VASWNFHTFKSVQVVAKAVKERRSEEGVEKVGKQPQSGRAASRTLVQKWTRAEQRGALLSTPGPVHLIKKIDQRSRGSQCAAIAFLTSPNLRR
jgi:hypothetical protein